MNESSFKVDTTNACELCLQAAFMAIPQVFVHVLIHDCRYRVVRGGCYGPVETGE